MSNVFSMANTYGRGVNDRQRQTINDQQISQNEMLAKDAEKTARLEDVQWIAGATRYGAENPDAIPGILKEAEQRGLGQFDMRQMTPEVLMQIHHEAVGALGGQAQQDQRKYEKAADGRFRYVDDGSEVFSGINPSSDMTAAQREAIWLANEASDDERRAYITGKRGEPSASSNIEKQLIDANDAAFKAESNAQRYEKLASDLVASNPDSGIAASWMEQYKTIVGREDAVSLLRKEWNNLRVSAAVQNLPPGVASDKDIELVMSAFLPEFAKPETIASFMRGLAKIEYLNAEFNDFKSQYLSAPPYSPVGMREAWTKYIAQKSSRADNNDAPTDKFQAEWSAAPSGAVLLAPDGTYRRKP